MEDKALPVAPEEKAAWAQRVQAAAGTFAYPPTPDLAGAVRRQLTPDARRSRTRAPRPGWIAAIVVLALAAGLLAVPQVRGAVLEVLRIGAVRIFRTEPAPLRPEATVVPLSSLLDLAGETTLEAAQARVDFPLRVPAYPPGLAAPDAVFVQHEPGTVVIMVWRAEGEPGTVGLSLFQMAADAYFAKLEPQVVEETEVAGRAAIWTEGPYVSLTRNGDFEYRRLVEGHALIWTNGPVTYRLETRLGLDEARRIAESLR